MTRHKLKEEIKHISRKLKEEKVGKSNKVGSSNKAENASIIRNIKPENSNKFIMKK